MDRRDKPASPRALAGAKDAEMAARRQREASEGPRSFVGDVVVDDSDVYEDDEDDEEEEEVTTRVFEVELGGGSSPWATAFLECASEGDLATLSSLLDDGKVELNDVDVDGFTALMIAAAEAQHDVAMELLRRGADVSIRTHEMRSTALHFAAKSGAAQVVEAICAQDPLRVDAQNLDGDTPLVWACTEGRVEAVRVLLAHGANVNVVSHRAMSALICAVMLRESDGSDDELSDAEDVAATDADRAEIVRLLLAKNPKLVNYQDRDGSTAMHLAASHGYLLCVKALLEFGADITLRNAIGQTPLEEAEETGIEAKSGKCISHLRMIWKKLEEEAAARMMAMLEMEESSQAGGGTPRSTKKTNKKKQKKAKRRTSKATATTSASTEKAAEDKAAISSGEASSEEEDEQGSEKRHQTGEDGGGEAPLVDVPAEAPSSDANEVVTDPNKEDQKADILQDGGVWTTVGRKHNQYLSQRAASAPPTGGIHTVESKDSAKTAPGDDGAAATRKKVVPVSPRSKPSRTMPTATLYSGFESTPRSVSARSRDKTTAKKVTPAKDKSNGERPGENHVRRASAMSTAAYPPPSASVPPPPPLAAFEAEALPVNSPFSTFQRLHNNSRLYERYERVPEAAVEAAHQVRGSVSVTGGSGGDSPYSSSLWRASPMGRTIHMPFSLDASVGLPMHSSLEATSASSPAAIWRYTSPTFPQGHDRSSLLASKRLAPTDRVPHPSSDPVLRSLSCGLCGELVNDNRQCSNATAALSATASNGSVATTNTNASALPCLQLYCAACLARAGVGVSESAVLACVKCRSPLQPRAMKQNDFAQAQAAAMGLRGSTLQPHHHLHLQRQIDPYEDMRVLMDRTSDRVRVADVAPFFLVPGANLASLSVGQLDALEELHLAAMQQITQARLENARLLERLRVEEWLKTQRDVFQFASHTASS